MIKSFLNKGLQTFFEMGSKAGLQPHHAPTPSRQLARLDVAKAPEDMNVPGWKFHVLHRDLEGHYSITVNGHWRMTFTFENGDVVLVNYQEHD